MVHSIKNPFKPIYLSPTHCDGKDESGVTWPIKRR